VGRIFFSSVTKNIFGANLLKFLSASRPKTARQVVSKLHLTAKRKWNFLKRFSAIEQEAKKPAIADISFSRG
jgi:hypothetical protein